jgi:hypothetical protein
MKNYLIKSVMYVFAFFIACGTTVVEPMLRQAAAGVAGGVIGVLVVKVAVLDKAEKRLTNKLYDMESEQRTLGGELKKMERELDQEKKLREERLQAIERILDPRLMVEKSEKKSATYDDDEGLAPIESSPKEPAKKAGKCKQYLWGHIPIEMVPFDLAGGGD